MCVIFNPKAGKGRAKSRLEELMRVLGSRAEYQRTTYPGHADELAEKAAQSGFAVVVAAGGDGTVHEVCNGLLRAHRPDVDFAVYPIGSANDYAHSVVWNFPEADRNEVRAVDVGRVRAANGRERFFVCCLGLGFNGAVTLEARRIKESHPDLEGVLLYGLAALRALKYHLRSPKMELVIDDQTALRLPTFMFSVLVGRREGGFVMAPEARLDDGWLDYVHCGSLSRWEVVCLLPRVAFWGPPAHHHKVRLGQCREVRLHSSTPLIVHVDGEFFCWPEDKMRHLDIDILPGALRVWTSLDPQKWLSFISSGES
jgi:diacylglycerol kinase family enzyme